MKMIKAIFATGLLIMLSPKAFAYKYVIFTDEKDGKKSEEVKELMKSTYPFNTYLIEIEIVKLTPAELECQSSEGIERLVTCKDHASLNAKAMRRGGDQAMIVKDTGVHGGSSGVGSGIPVITTQAPAKTMIHEYLHNLGLCDEYEYKAKESEMFCDNTNSQYPNTVYILPKSSYSGDQNARDTHNSEIPWYGDILPTTFITNSGGSQFGTGKVDEKKKAPYNNTTMPQILDEPMGVYRGKMCNQAKPPRPTWHPSGNTTIMENLDAGLGAPMEKVVDKILKSKGLVKKLGSPEPLEFFSEAPRAKEVVVQMQKGGDVFDNVRPSPIINDTGRGFFKGLFDWMSNIFEQFSNALTR
jgi:hypothetical protein